MADTSNVGSLSQYRTGVIGPCEGQEDCFAGIGSCGVFREMLVNSMHTNRHSKVLFSGEADAATKSVTFAAQTHEAFAQSVGDTGTTVLSGYTGYPLTPQITDYFTFENPVPENSNMLFCAVGLAISVERMFIAKDGDVADGLNQRYYPSYITSAPDIRETVREDLLNGISMLWKVGNNGCIYRVGLAKHYAAAAEAKGGDKIGSGVFASPLDFVCFNAVLCIDSLRNNRRATLELSLDEAVTAASSTLDVIEPSDTYVRAPVEAQLYGFIVAFQGAGNFSGSAPSFNRA